MPKPIVLNGCINSGKSTVAGRLKAAVPNLAHVEVDDLHAFISWMPIERAMNPNLENAKRDRGTRALTPWELDRIEWMHRNGLARPGFGEVIDNTGLSIDATVEAVIRLAGLSGSPKEER